MLSPELMFAILLKNSRRKEEIEEEEVLGYCMWGLFLIKKPLICAINP